jgi:hypothetical protein
MSTAYLRQGINQLQKPHRLTRGFGDTDEPESNRVAGPCPPTPCQKNRLPTTPCPGLSLSR